RRSVASIRNRGAGVSASPPSRRWAASEITRAREAHMTQGANPDRRVALVTGASYGVGAATALALARDGFALALTATKSQNLDAVLANIASAGGRAFGIELDLRHQESIENAVVRAVGKLGQIDVLV